MPLLRRRLVAGVATAVALAAAVAAGQAWAARTAQPAGRLPALGPVEPPAAPASPTPRTASPTPRTSPAAPSRPDWRALLAALDRRRAEAFRQLDPEILGEVYAAGADALRRDRAALAELTAAGGHAVGLRFELLAVSPRAVSGGRATLRVVDRLPPYDVVGADGQVIRHDPGRGARAFTLVLVDAGSGWRIAGESEA